MALRIDLADAPGPPLGPLFGLAQIAGFAAFIGFLFNLPFGAILWLVSLVLPPISAEALASAFNVPVDDFIWRVTTPLFAAAAFALLFWAWIIARNWLAPHYDAPFRTLMARLRRLQRAAPFTAHRAPIWGALNLVALAALLAALLLLPRGSLREALSFLPVGVLVALVLSSIAFLILNGARLLSGSGTLAGTVIWLLSRAAPVIAFLLGPLIGSGLVLAVTGEFSGWMMAGGIGGAVAAWFCIDWLSRRFSARIHAEALPRAKDALWGDNRRPILFLRSFKDDAQAVRLTPEGEPEPEDSISRLEDVIADLLRAYGPVIAVGEPGVLPKSGAARAFYDGDDWQEAVATWMDQSLVVVMMAGYTEGLIWEMDTLIKRGHAKKLIAVFPPDRRRFDERWARLKERFAYQPLGPELTAADTNDVIAVHPDASGQLVTFSSPTRLTTHYQTALSLALVGKFSAGRRLAVPATW